MSFLKLIMNYPKLKRELYKIFPSESKIRISSKWEKAWDKVTTIYLRERIEPEFYVSINRNNEIATILNFSIGKKHQSQGKGTQLYKLIEQFLKDDGYDTIELYLVLSTAYDFWRKNGFEIDIYHHGTKDLNRNKTN